MSNLQAFTFRVNIIDNKVLNSSPSLSSSVQLGKSTVWVEGYPGALKQGDIFTLYGNAGQKVKDLYIGKLPQTLELYDEPLKTVVLINNDYVDYELGNYGSEASNLVASLEDLGFSPLTFTKVDIRGFSDATTLAGSKGIILIPELENGDIDPDITSPTRLLLRTWIAGGGNLVMFDPTSGDLIDFLNNTFSFSLESNNADEPISLTTEGGQLPEFNGASSTISKNSATKSIDTTTLPSGSVTVYTGDEVNQSVITVITYGNGSILIMGWDWYNALPVGANDGGWNDILYRYVNSRLGCLC